MNCLFGLDPKYKDGWDAHDKMLRRINERGLLRAGPLNDIVRVTARGLEENIGQLVSRSFSLVDAHPWERVAGPVVDRSSKGTSAEVSLFPLIRDFVARVATPSAFGTAFTEQEGLFDALWVMDQGFNLLAAGLPRWLPLPVLAPAHAGRNRLLDILAAFHSAQDQVAKGEEPPAEWGDMGDVSELMRLRAQTMRELALPAKDRASYDLAFLWAYVHHPLSTLMHPPFPSPTTPPAPSPTDTTPE